MSDKIKKQVSNFLEFNTEYLTCWHARQPGEELQEFDLQRLAVETEVAIIKELDERTPEGILGFVTNPIIEVFNQLDNIISYIAGKFIFTTEDKQFAAQLSEVWFSLIRGGFFGGVYVCYSEEIKAVEKATWEKTFGNRTNRTGGEPQNFPRCNIRIFVREQEGTFRSILSNATKIKISEERLVYFSAAEIRYFRQTLRLALNYIEGLKGYTTVCRASSKRLICDVKNRKKFNAEITNIYETHCPVLERTSETGTQNIYQELVVFPVEEVNTYMKNILLGFDEAAKGLGIQGRNLGEKKERVTVGENEVDTDFIACIQMSLLQRLKAPFQYLKDIYKDIPEDLEIALYVKKVNNEVQEERNEETLVESDKIEGGGDE